MTTETDPARAGAPLDSGPGSRRLQRLQRLASRPTSWLLLAVVLAALAARGLFLLHWQENFDGDEAFIGIHAMELRRGELTLFLPGQAYMGMLESGLVAVCITLFGPHPIAVRLAPLLWVLPALAGLLALERRGRSWLAHGRGAGFLVTLWLFSPAVLFLAGVKARGGVLAGFALAIWSLVLVWPDARRRGVGSGVEHTPDRSTVDGTQHGTQHETQHGTPRGSLGGSTRRAFRWMSSGLLLGLAFWTHDSSLIVTPLLFAILVAEARRANGSGRADLWTSTRRAVRPLLTRGALFTAAVLVAYVPLWLPRVAACALGPTGIEGTSLDPDPRLLLTPRLPLDVLRLVDGALTTANATSQVGQVARILYAIVTCACVIVVLWAALARTRGQARFRPSPEIAQSPALLVTGWLAFVSVALFLMTPIYRADEQWFRYTFGLAPFLVVATAHCMRALSGPYAVSGTSARRGPALSYVATAVIMLLATIGTLQAHHSWIVHRPMQRMEALRELRAQGATRVEADWQIAYFIRFLSNGEILTATFTPPRLPDDNAAVALAAEVWTVAPIPEPVVGNQRRRRAERAGGASAPDASNEPPRKEAAVASPPKRTGYVVTQGRARVPEDVQAAFDSLAGVRTLYPQYEPFPLLPPDSYPRDWRGWPYRRPLDCFDAVVWIRTQSFTMTADRTQVEAAIRRLSESGEFRVSAEWNEGVILRRAGPTGGP